MLSGNSIKIDCPKCGESIPLNETLAGPDIEQMKAERDLAVSQARAEAQTQIDALQTERDEVAAKEKELADREAALQAELNIQLAAARPKIAEEERKNALKALTPELEAEKQKALVALERADAAEKAELALRNEKTELDRRANSLDLEVARLVDAKREEIQEQAVRDAEEAAKLKLAEKDQLIKRLTEQAEEMKRKGQVGSQQAQGDALELDFEASLRQSFVQDTIEPVKTGVRGGDLIQRVLGEIGRPVGSILWETKRAQVWGGDWAAKARQDAAEAKAEITVIVSDALPKGMCDFGPQDGVWAVRPSHAVMLGIALRQGIISTAKERQGVLGRETKAESLYAYMIGPEFRATLEGIALPFHELRAELDSEKRATLPRWRRQERRIERVLASVATLQGDLQGIAGSEMPALPGFEPETQVEEDQL
jgi:hypothetical protein